ncbi:protein FAR-RED IMPAIRED RESPONSE 1-like [Olea europaea var. sylvestris]|uniref:protein FAR-RED IMPAIRED RESPONSE 1-like n=1 Tax=Olea europaea var. sylvestris TaxID=158386 RepID=UPI000C1CF524|nr:protein FAR-RED IMPAIRED RESPONSE 1-like [Olea europaea var. sylvestris]
MTEKGEERVEVSEDEVLVQSSNRGSTENVVTMKDDVLGEDGTIVPELEGDGTIVSKVGIKFKDESELYKFYKKYAYNVGFLVWRMNSRKGEDGVVRSVTLTCCRDDRRSTNTSNSLKSQPTIQTGCKANLTASIDIHGIWKICTVCLEHNHKTSHSKSRLYRCNRELSANVKRKLEVNDMTGIPLHKSYNYAVVEAGGDENMTCVEKDCRNYVEQVRCLRLGDGDAAVIQSYFSQMQAQCSRFYFSMDLDEESRLKNLFWADNRYRLAYKEFRNDEIIEKVYCDVISAVESNSKRKYEVEDDVIHGETAVVHESPSSHVDIPSFGMAYEVTPNSWDASQ